MTQVLAGRYELGEPLGSGGMARVVVALDRVLDRRVAVKLLDPGAAALPRSRERFLAEARAAARLSHPHAVAVYDTGSEGELAYIVMELVEGRSLAEALTRRGRFPVDEALAVMDAVLAALDAAHGRGLVHRDVKPGNVLVGYDGTVKLADFGIAKATETEHLTVTGHMIGTPAYVAPEQAAGDPATPASDVYAAGVVLYELLAGTPPFTGLNPLAVVLAHQRDPVPPLGERRPSVPPGVVAVVQRALAKRPEDRYIDGGAMRAALREAPVAPARATLPVATGALTGAAATQVLSNRDLHALADGRTSWQDVRRPPARRAVPVRAGPSPWLVAGLSALALLGTWLAIRSATAQDPGTVPAAATTAAAPPTATPPAVAPPPTPEAVPSAPGVPAPLAPGTAVPAAPDLRGLLLGLAQDPAAAGERGGELLQELGRLATTGREDQAAEAAELVDEVREWVEDGELAPAVGERVEALLAPLAAAAGRGDEDRDD